jgi:toxin ParE1/3/4
VPPEITIRAAARREIEAQGRYLEESAGAGVADRFFAALAASFETLAHRPKAGALCGFRRAALRGVRRWPVTGFENWLIFYLPRAEGVEVVHIIHGARDIETLLGP